MANDLIYEQSFAKGSNSNICSFHSSPKNFICIVFIGCRHFLKLVMRLASVLQTTVHLCCLTFFKWSFFICRDLVHRQTACSAIKHMALGVYGFGCEDALIHLLNYMWPNVFETSPHLVQAFLDGVEGLRVALGPIKILQYTLQVRIYQKFF